MKSTHEMRSGLWAFGKSGFSKRLDSKRRAVAQLLQPQACCGAGLCWHRPSMVSYLSPIGVEMSRMVIVNHVSLLSLLEKATWEPFHCRNNLARVYSVSMCSPPPGGVGVVCFMQGCASSRHCGAGEAWGIS